MEPSVVIASY